MAPCFGREFQRTLLRSTPTFQQDLRLRGCHPLRPTIPGGSARSCWRVYGSVLQPHILDGLPRLVRFGLCRFRSPLLPASRLVSFPPPTEMFHFGGFPLLSEHLGLLGPDRRSYSGIPGSTSACDSPGLIAACHALLRRHEPSHPPPAVLPNRFCLEVAPCPLVSFDTVIIVLSGLFLNFVFCSFSMFDV